MEVLSRSVDDTIALGQRLGALAAPGLCLALHGPLGAGKTQLVRGIALGARIADPDLVSSPTYVLLNVYPPVPNDPAGKIVYHLDAYRAHGVEDFAAVGLEEILQDPDAAGLVVIEWPSRIPELLPDDHVAITLEPRDQDTRAITLAGTGPQAQSLVDQLSAGT